MRLVSERVQNVRVDQTLVGAAHHLHFAIRLLTSAFVTIEVDRFSILIRLSTGVTLFDYRRWPGDVYVFAKRQEVGATVFGPGVVAKVIAVAQRVKDRCGAVVLPAFATTSGPSRAISSRQVRAVFVRRRRTTQRHHHYGDHGGRRRHLVCVQFRV